jgi:hypothetical protein
VVTSTALVVEVVPLMFAADSLAILAFVSEAKIDEKPWKVFPERGSPPIRLGLAHD